MGELENRPSTPEPTPAPTPAALRPKNTPAQSDRAKKLWKSAVKTLAHQHPGDLKGLDEHYKLEDMDPRHRMGPILEELYQKLFLYVMPQFKDKRRLFFDFLEGFQQECPDAYRTALYRVCGEHFNEETLEHFIISGVKYLESDADRRSNQLRFMAGKLYRTIKQAFDTTSMSTKVHGTGWAIYVVSPTDQWYAGSHVIGQFQHSTFLGGRPVLAAGEMKVSNGVPQVLTGMSGHYKPGMDQFVRGIVSLKKAGVNLDSTNVQVTEIETKQVKMVSANAFLTNHALRSRYDNWIDPRSL
jgi:hypothetical protein